MVSFAHAFWDVETESLHRIPTASTSQYINSLRWGTRGRERVFWWAKFLWAVCGVSLLEETQMQLTVGLLVNRVGITCTSTKVCGYCFYISSIALGFHKPQKPQQHNSRSVQKKINGPLLQEIKSLQCEKAKKKTQTKKTELNLATAQHACSKLSWLSSCLTTQIKLICLAIISCHETN